jgi:galactose-1-phosphate uridylyltransferase
MTRGNDGPVRVLEKLPDGTVRQQSPLTGTVVWTVPGRSNRPIPSALPAPQPLGTSRPDATCAFCAARYLETPPEQSRLVLDPDARGHDPWRILDRLTADQLTDTVADCRRFPNLFEILPFDYWHANHGYEIPEAAAARARQYMATAAGRAHVLAIERTRMQAAGAGTEQVAAEPEERLLARAVTLFASSHDVIAARRHFVDGATHDDQLASSGDLNPLEHHAFLALTVAALAEMNGANPFARYVVAFQNWLRPAGASFDHLHKQLVALDEYGPLMTRILDMVSDDPDLFNSTIADPAARDGLVIAENEHCIALAGVGHRYPTVEIFATGTTQLPWEHSPEALRGVSDVLHACHAATGRLVPTNEEWHYRPVGAGAAMPWRINLKWRVSTLAGFEGGTKINVNTISPFTLRQRMVDALGELRTAGRIGPMAIGDECSHRLGVLRCAGR